MGEVAIHTLNPGFKLQFAPPFVVPESISTRLDDIWAEEKGRRGDRLTNGQIYSLYDYSPDCLTLQPAEYRHVLARRRAPDLVDAGLAIRPVAVTGVLLCADGLVLGRRGDQVASDAGLWEPAPAGGLNRPDPAAQVLEELREELGVKSSGVAPPEACGLVEDMESGVHDIVFRLHTTASAEDIRATHKTLGTNEYAELAIVRQPDVAAFLETNHGRLLPALSPMLRLVGLL